MKDDFDRLQLHCKWLCEIVQICVTKQTCCIYIADGYIRSELVLGPLGWLGQQKLKDPH